ncbi:hypothetical protein ALT1545_30028 [Alteromonas macleodii]
MMKWKRCGSRLNSRPIGSSLSSYNFTVEVENQPDSKVSDLLITFDRANVSTTNLDQ